MMKRTYYFLPLAFYFKSGGVAQLGERAVRIRKVGSSILLVSTIQALAVCRCFLFCSFVRGTNDKTSKNLHNSTLKIDKNT